MASWSSPSMATPISRRGPSSRLLQRQSLLFPGGGGGQPDLEATVNVAEKTVCFPSSPAAAAPPAELGRPIKAADVTRRSMAAGNATLMNTVLGSPEVTRPLYSYRSEASSRLDHDDDEGAPGSRALGLGVDVEVRTTENLFVDFLATLSGGLDADAEPNVEKTLDNVADFEQLVDEHVLRLQRVIEKQSSRVQKQNSVATQVKTNLVVERNSWRLIGKLFADRLLVNFGEDGDHEMVADDRITMKSEKRIAEKLFQRERSLRQAQAIVDWLEQNAKDTLEDEFRQTDFFGDLLVGWENTLHALRMGSGDERRMVTELDPDARSRQKKPLHDLDEQDQSRLVKAIYLCIRSGMLDNAQDLCVRLGQPWRAATLIGWKLCHDPNYESTDCTEKHPVEGNASRDVWKRSAWVLTEDAALSAQEKAIYSALCGNSGQLLRSGVCRSWEDYMWALVRSMVDVKVEQEIRATMVRSFSELPKRYWENLSDLEAILNSLVSVESKEVREEVATPHRILQRFIMLEEWDSLNKYLLLHDWRKSSCSW